MTPDHAEHLQRLGARAAEEVAKVLKASNIELGPSCIPLEVQQRRAGGENVDVDGWTRPRDLRDEALEDLRKQNGDLRQKIEQRDADIVRWTARIKELEARLQRVVDVAEGREAGRVTR